MQRINKLAWKIRRKAAIKHACKVMTINWGFCYNRARNIIEKRQEVAIRRVAKRYAKRDRLKAINSSINSSINTGIDSILTRTLIQGLLLIPFVVCCICIGHKVGL